MARYKLIDWLIDYRQGNWRNSIWASPQLFVSRSAVGPLIQKFCGSVSACGRVRGPHITDIPVCAPMPSYHTSSRPLCDSSVDAYGRSTSICARKFAVWGRQKNWTPAWFKGARVRVGCKTFFSQTNPLPRDIFLTTSRPSSQEYLSAFVYYTSSGQKSKKSLTLSDLAMRIVSK